MIKSKFSELKNSRDFHVSILNHLGDGICVVNQNLEIVYHNNLFAEIFKSDGADLNQKRFGESISCRGHEKNFAYSYCNNCKIRRAMLEAFRTKNDQEKNTIVMELSSTSQKSTRLIQYRSFYLKHNNTCYVATTFNDLTNMGEETLKHINAIYEESEDLMND